MKALHFDGKTLKLKEVNFRINDAEAVIRILKSGICNTDLEIVRGYAGFVGVLGHEFVGIVERCPEVAWIGKRVVGEINVGCGVCSFCKAGDSRHCPRRTVLGIHGRDGAHAEFVSLPTRNLLEVPETITDEEAVFVEPLAAAYAITERIEIYPTMKVAVIGDGKLGLLSAMILSLKSDNVTLIGKHQHKLAIAERHGIETALIEKPQKYGRLFDIVVEASGNKTGMQMAMDIVQPKGFIVLKSTFHGETPVEMWRAVVDEISIVGSRCGKFAPALEILKKGKIKVRELISEIFSLDKGIEAFEAASKKGALKILLSM
ncbi:MAG: alcohol dehydrogenase [Acidobacteria bacterium]|nr:MAG: alcohol dehydrogenase [Acidobacteriota bacterium]